MARVACGRWWHVARGGMWPVVARGPLCHVASGGTCHEIGRLTTSSAHDLPRHRDERRVVVAARVCPSPVRLLALHPCRYDEALKLAVLTREAEDINDARKITVPTSRQRQITGTI